MVDNEIVRLTFLFEEDELEIIHKPRGRVCEIGECRTGQDGCLWIAGSQQECNTYCNPFVESNKGANDIHLIETPALYLIEFLAQRLNGRNDLDKVRHALKRLIPFDDKGIAT